MAPMPDAIKENKMGRSWTESGTIAIALGTFVLAIGTIGLAILGIRQGSVMEDQLAVTRDQLNTMKVSNDNFYIAQRPYVYIEFENIAALDKSQSVWTASLRIGNTGSTVTKDFRYLADCSSSSNDAVVFFAQRPKDMPLHIGQLMPNSWITFNCGTVTKQVLDNLLQDKLKLFFFGIATYQDFIRDEFHITEACGMIHDIHMKGGNLANRGIDECPFKGHNCTDKDC
jgi:hypothetical protein